MSEYLYLLVMGAVQGATEFLPVSSSGHLAAGELLFNMNSSQSMVVEVLLHLATLAAVILFYRKDVAGLFVGLGDVAKALKNRQLRDVWKQNENVQMLTWLIVGTIPTGIIGLLMEKTGMASYVGSHSNVLGITFLVCAAILLLTLKDNSADKVISLKTALIIGVVQGLAVFPGISRSGFTISVAMLLGLSRKDAARFSFLLSIPAILAAALLELSPDALSSSFGVLPLAVGFLSSFIVGLACLWLLVKLVKAGKLWMFSPYVGGVGIAVIAFL